MVAFHFIPLTQHIIFRSFATSRSLINNFAKDASKMFCYKKKQIYNNDTISTDTNDSSLADLIISAVYLFFVPLFEDQNRQR